MSGICGVMARERDGQVLPGDVDSMTRALGNAGEVALLSTASGRVGLGARVLGRHAGGVRSLLAGGHTYALAFCGSLYEVPEPVAPPVAKDADLLTTLLRLYTREGLGCLQRLCGDFALAVWDGADETLHVATDRFRVHPIFYGEDRHRFVFASRMTGIIAGPRPACRTIDLAAIVDVVASSVVSTPKTVFAEVRKLPPAHVVSHRGDGTRVSRYWDVSFLDPDHSAPSELARMLRTNLEHAVASRLGVDRGGEGVGTFLSGGVDSSSITGLVARLTGRPVQSFSIAFSEERYNEIDYARIAAQAVGAAHHERVVTADDVCAMLGVLTETFDEPFANASAIPTYHCARLAHEHGVDVLYAGDGGDELFAGNERYALQRTFDYYSRIPGWVREPLLRPVVSSLAHQTGWRLFEQARKYIERASIPYPERLSSYNFLRVFPPQELFDAAFLDEVGRGYDPYAVVAHHYAEAPARDALDRQLYIDLKLAISDNDVIKVTRMADAAGVTVRFPFLDHHLAEFASRIPARIRMRGRQLRSFFKHAYKDLLPPEIRAKKKHGFGLPISTWLVSDRRLNEMLHDLVLGPTAVQRGYFRRSALAELVARHREDRTGYYGTVLWNLMVLELWHRRWSTAGRDKVAVPA